MENEVTTEMVDITPAIAEEMLKSNFTNRSISEQHVRFLSDQMIEKRWMFDGQPIRFDQSGSLLDGQHRLSAIVKSGTTQKTLVIKGVDSEAFKVMDTGKLRNAADVFSMHGISQAAQAAAVARYIVAHINSPKGLASSYRKTSNQELLEFYNANPTIRVILNESVAWYREFNRVVTLTHIAAFRFMMGQKHQEDSDKFWKSLCYGTSLSEDSPVRALRKVLTEDKISDTKLHGTQKKALIVKAWNFFRKDEKSKFIKFNKDKETYPIIM